LFYGVIQKIKVARFLSRHGVLTKATEVIWQRWWNHCLKSNQLLVCVRQVAA